MTTWLPPSVRPWNESAGYVGYYARTYLSTTFDLVDIDGVWPAVWHYGKKSSSTYRIIEEKPSGQQMHGSQWRLYRVWTEVIDEKIATGDWSRSSGVYVVWDAERLAVPEFPIRLSRVGASTYAERSAEMTRDEFDHWMTEP